MSEVMETQDVQTTEQHDGAETPVAPSAPDIADIAYERLMAAQKEHGDRVPDSVLTSIAADIKTKTASPNPSEPAAGGSEEGKADKGGQVASTNNAEYREMLLISRNALKRDGWSDERLAKLDEATIIEVGGKRKAEQDKQARDWAKSRGKSATPADDARSEEPEDQQIEPGDEDTAIEAEPTRVEGLDDVLDELDDDAKQRVKNALKAERQRATLAEKQALAVTVRGVRQRLAADFPKLGDDAAFQAVLARMDKIGGRSMRPSEATIEVVESMMRDAAWIEFGQQAQRAARTQHVSRVAENLNGQPDLIGHSGQVRSKPLTEDDRAAIAFQAVQKHPGNREAQSSYLRAHGVV